MTKSKADLDLRLKYATFICLIFALRYILFSFWIFISSEPSAAKGPMPKKRRRKDPTITTRVYNEQEWKQLQLTNTAAGHCDYRSKHVNNKSSLSSGAQKRNIDKISGKETVLALESRNLVGHSKGLVTESNNCSNSSTREKEISGYIEMNPRKVSNGENEVKIKKEKGEFFEPSTSGSVYPVQPMVSSLFLSQDLYLFILVS